VVMIMATTAKIVLYVSSLMRRTVASG
jgi:hypothetical protein